MTAARPVRRRVLAAGLGAGALALGVSPLAGCAPAPSAPPAPDPLEPVAEQAEIDVRLATAVAAAHPDLARPAVALASDRRQHATALRAELRRARPVPQITAPQITAPQITAPQITAPQITAPQPVVAPHDSTAARAALAGALQAAQDVTSALVAAAPGHRAALLASIAACCASHQAVLP